MRSPALGLALGHEHPPGKEKARRREAASALTTSRRDYATGPLTWDPIRSKTAG